MAGVRSEAAKRLGWNIRRVMCERGLTQHMLAASMGVQQGTISNWCTGKKQPKAESIAKMCRVLKCTADELLEGLL